MSSWHGMLKRLLTPGLDEQEVHWYLDTTDKVIVIHIILQLYHLSLFNICLLFRDLLTM